MTNTKIAAARWLCVVACALALTSCSTDDAGPNDNAKDASGDTETTTDVPSDANACFDGKPCDDGDPCTEGDKCDADGTCTGAPKDCDDGSPCTENACDPGKKRDDPAKCTATAANEGKACDDGSKCTNNDACASGKCTGPALVCNDNDPCTKDSCDPAAGCAHGKQTGIGCDDGNPCTVGDSCFSGECQAGKTTECEAKGACQLATCDPKTGKCVRVREETLVLRGQVGEALRQDRGGQLRAAVRGVDHLHQQQLQKAHAMGLEAALRLEPRLGEDAAGGEDEGDRGGGLSHLRAAHRWQGGLLGEQPVRRAGPGGGEERRVPTRFREARGHGDGAGGGRVLHLRADGEPDGAVLGAERRRAGGQRQGWGRAPDADPGGGAQRCGEDPRQGASHVRGAEGRRGQVLGRQRRVQAGQLQR